MERYTRVLMMLGALLLAACTEDSENEIPAGEDVLQLSAYTQAMDTQLSVRTRAIPNGYSIYPEAGAEEASRIGVYLTTEDMADGTPTLGNFIFANNKWNSLVNVRPGLDYYIYGFMPSDIGSCTLKKSGESFATGAVMEFERILPVQAKDLCVVVGVQDITSESDEVSVTQGNFCYHGKTKEDGNLVRLMFNHALSGVQFRMTIAEDYAKLRDIRLKEARIRAGSIYAYKGTFTFFSDGSRYLGWTTNGNLTTEEAKGTTLFLDEVGVSLSTTEAKIINGYCLHVVSADITLVSRYDVYDINGNLVREDCIAENKIVLPGSPGKRTIFRMTVKPTYLYVLSDPDLDSPSAELTVDN